MHWTKRVSVGFFLAQVFMCQMVAQSIAISEEISLKNDHAYHILGEFDGQVLLLRDQSTEFEVHAYDPQLHEKWARPLDFEKRNSDILAVVRGDTSFHVVYSYKHKGDFFIKHHEYGPDVAVLDTNVVTTIRNQYFAPKFRSVVSEDRSKVLLVRADKESELLAAVYDLHVRELVWKKRVSIQNGSIRRNFRQMVVTNAGDMFVITDHERTSRRHREFNIMIVDASSAKLSKGRASLGDVSASDIYATYDNVNERLLMSGMYARKYGSKLQGLFLFSLEIGMTKATTRIMPLTKEILAEIHGKEVKDKKGLSDFRVKDILLRQDGGALILSEMHKEYSRRPNVPMRRDEFGVGGWVDYYLEDVIVTSVHADGSDHWKMVLHKKQYSQDDNAVYSSYFVFKTPEKIRLLFNDEIRQENTISEYAIRGNGYYKRESVFSTDYHRLKLRFRDGIQISHNECIVPSERNSRLSLVRITFAD